MNKKICVLGDLHLGARNASPILCEYQLKYFETELFPYILEHKISTILQLGDLFDSRKFSNHVILYAWKQRFFNFLEEHNIEFITLLGNHDLAYKHSLSVSSTELFLNSYKNIKIIKSPQDTSICGVPFLLVPWICDENSNTVKSMIRDTDAIFCAGHFEFSGFEMQKGVSAHGETDTKDFDKFDLVFSGHYHTRSKKKNILYTGIPYEMTWADYDDQKGFHIFDAKTHKISFIKTKTSLFHRIEYDDSDGLKRMYVNSLKDAYVKVVVVNKTDPSHFDKFITNILLENPADLKITDIKIEFDDIDTGDMLKLDDTKTMITKFISQIETDLDKDVLGEYMHTLYINALEITV